jgi:hypothetical protein
METHLPNPMTARVYVNFLEGMLVYQRVCILGGNSFGLISFIYADLKVTGKHLQIPPVFR